MVDPAPESSLLTYEIFGPLLPIVPYDSLDAVMAYIAVRDRPLALYLFTLDKSVQERVVYGSISGGVTINNCVVHAFQHHMPFGGVGASGIGQYHAFEGFMEFSKLRPVFTYPNFLSSEIMAPPYGQKHKTLYRWLNRLGL